MAIAIGFDVHRAQITFDALDKETGEVKTGRIAPADRSTLGHFLAGFTGQEVRAALEATTGWRFVCEELERIARRPTWPSRPARALFAAQSLGRRPTASMAATCGSSSSTDASRIRGSATDIMGRPTFGRF